MKIEGLFEQTPLDIKQECAECPHLRRAQKGLGKANAEKQDISERAMRPNATVQARILAAEQLGDLEHQEAQLRINAEFFQDGCPGTLEMNAQDTLGRTVTAYVCSSPGGEKIYGSLGDTEQATIRRTQPEA